MIADGRNATFGCRGVEAHAEHAHRTGGDPRRRAIDPPRRPPPTTGRPTAIVQPDGSAAPPVDCTEQSGYVAVMYDRCDHITGPFFHGTMGEFGPGDLLTAGHESNYHDGRLSNNVYFAALMEPAIWGAELAVAFADSEDARGHVYVVEPTGPFEDDPNVTNKRFPGNVTRSYRTRHPLRVVEEVESWEGHSPEAVQGMLDGIARLREQGLDVTED